MKQNFFYFLGIGVFLMCVEANAQLIGREQPAPNVRITRTGHVFIRDTSNAALGEAWRDGSGMIWGDLKTHDDRSVHYMSQVEAAAYCQRIGAQLPSREDFERLRSYMGASTESSYGFAPQVLPNLRNGTYWSSSAHIDHDDGWGHYEGGRGWPYAYYFIGYYGYFGDEDIYHRHYDREDYYGFPGPSIAVRCVVRR